MIRNNINGFGNDYYTEFLVHSNFIDSSKNSHDLIINNYSTSTNQTHFDSHSILPVFNLKGETSMFGSTGITVNQDNFCFDAWVWIDIRVITDAQKYIFVPMALYDPEDGWNPSNMPVTALYSYFNVDSSNISLRTGYFNSGVTEFQLLLDNLDINKRWNHLAFVKSFGYNDDGYFIYINGQKNLITRNNYSHNLTNKNFVAFIPKNQNFSGNNIYYFDELRCTVGHPRWISDFNPPNRMY